ncbi:PH domain-like protein [Dothidotthia symphoricarpi CBS 119687]|uniref:PH domain-like protein n=1 Tax=Dothidotthia symphoricarpi CBS 119687 TaxID=1392245 RepID=A0A6A6A6L8_9PLEO|nr:PH domain-like protein [Dothidotthia symphoricarpi CBS 119687]KAF2126567.1 PH domain-like protein [Dothidotthia symphoricarpi CBS 119687]
MAATMAGAQQPQTPSPTSSSKPIPIRTAGMKLDTFSPLVQHRTNPGKAANLIMSPVNQNGCFEFDRIIKAGNVVKRTRKTKSWKPIHIVLRPNCLSIYKDKDETKLRHQINLAEITAVARQKDSKKKMDHVFGIFSPARNFHLGTSSEKEAQEWVDLIRAEAHIDDDEDDMVLMSPNGGKRTFTGFDRTKRENIGSSSSEAELRQSTSKTPATMYSARRPSHTLNYSGNERGSLSDLDFSDTGFPGSAVSLPRQAVPRNRNVSQQSNIGTTPDEERVVYHGWLYVLKSKGGVRQWKKLWIVLRAKSLAFYKNDQEYSAILIIPFSSIIDAVDIDPVSRSKQYCMQVLSEEKNFRFCATGEDSLAKWLGAFKSLLIKRKEAEQKRVHQTSTNTGNAQASQKPIAIPNMPPPSQSLGTK